jgi:hypothetical protein
MPVIISGATSGATTIQATDAVTATITLPSATDTLVGKATTDTLTNKTLTLPVVGTTIGVGGATPSASGSGITFPATQSASTNANTLDDYEEGTWTPTISGTTLAGTGTYSVQTGSYTKIGRLVMVTASLNWSVHTGTGSMTITNLPFASGNVVSGAEYMAIPEFSAMTMPASTTPMVLIVNNVAYISVYTQLVGTGSLANLAMDSAAVVYFNLTYQTA